jgi:hypothetical protein
MQRAQKKAVVAYFKVLAKSLFAWRDSGNHEKSQAGQQYLNRDSKVVRLEYETGMLTALVATFGFACSNLLEQSV